MRKAARHSHSAISCRRRTGHPSPPFVRALPWIFAIHPPNPLSRLPTFRVRRLARGFPKSNPSTRRNTQHQIHPCDSQNSREIFVQHTQERSETVPSTPDSEISTDRMRDLQIPDPSRTSYGKTVSRRRPDLYVHLRRRRRAADAAEAAPAQAQAWAPARAHARARTSACARPRPRRPCRILRA